MSLTGSTPSRTLDRRAWTSVVLATWLIVSVDLITRLNVQGIVPQSQRTLYVVPAYAGLAALAIYIVVATGAAVRREQPWRSPFEGGNEWLPLGFALLLVYTAVDLAWVLWFGEEYGIAEGLSPARLLLAAGLAIVAVGPVRGAFRPGGSSKLAGAVALGLTVAVVVFPVGPMHPLEGAYATRPSGALEDDSEIWTMAADGSGQTRLITAGDGTEVSLPVWSPDGRSIAFTRWERGDDGTTQADVWVADADGRNPRPVATGPGNDWIPAWSPDGQWISFTADEAPQARPPAGPIGAAPEPGQPPGAITPRSPTAQTWVVHPDGSDRHKVTDVDGGAAAAVWSPDGRSLAYSSERGGQSDIYVGAVDGSSEVRLTDDLADDWAPSWSSDGRRVLFTSDRTGNNDIWAVGVDATGLAQLTDDGAADDVAAESPDGSRIAFVSTRSGDAEVWTMAPDGSDPVNITRRPLADDGRWSATWSPSGDALVYASAGTGPADTQPIVVEDLAVAGALLLAFALAGAAMAAVAIGLPFGAVTIMLAIVSTLAAFVEDRWALVPAMILVGVAVDAVVARAPIRRRQSLAAILTPAGVVLAYGLTLLALGSLAWTPTLLVGTTLAAGLIGWIMGTLLPAIPRVAGAAAVSPGARPDDAR